jgi:CXXC-20-CXXC protein
MRTCPHCNTEIRIRELPYQGFFESFRICPNCGGSFSVDTRTKYRQAALIFILLVSLMFTILLYFRGTAWLILALVSYFILGLIIYWGNRKLFYVPYQ